ncbi:MAG: hypothetical protein IJV00_08500 [Clostridia bacterium]|nr:hypothetical protein [Clostridia bacterium]
MNTTMFRRLKAKAKSRRGVSLAEMLIATLLLVLVSGAMVTGVLFASTSFSKSMMRSESKVLYSTLQNVIKNELANTKTVVLGEAKTDGSRRVDKFFSQNYASTLDLSSFRVIPSGREYGELALGSETEVNRLLSSSAYTYGLGAKVEVSYFESAPERFRVVLTICSTDGTELISEPFDVVPLNAVTKQYS